MQRSSVEDQRATSGDSGMERASNSDSRPGALSIEEAVALHRAGKLDEAESIYRAILDAVPLHADALHFLGVLLHGRGDRAASVQMLRKAIEQAPHNPSLWNNLGNVFLESRDSDAAFTAYTRAAECAADFAAPHNNLGILHRARGQLPEAEAAYRRALEIEPRFVAAWQNLSSFLIEVRRFDEAIACGLRAITLAPRDLSTLHHIGVAHLALKEFDKATAIYRTWLEKEPDNPIPQHLVAACEGRDIPLRASDAYIERTFDRFAATFEAKLEQLEYRAPSLVGEAVEDARGEDARGLRIVDLGCGTGLCAKHVRPVAAMLVGVDLSAGMLEQAKVTGAYDHLERSELTSYLTGHAAEFDVALSADTLCYFGALQTFAEAAHVAVVQGGLLVFTVESMAEDDGCEYRLHTNGRYVHAGSYVDSVLSRAGWTIEQRVSVVLRLELRQPVAGWLVTARKREPD